MAQKEEFIREMRKMRREIGEKVRAKNQREFRKNLNKNEEMLILKFQFGREDWLLIYVDKNIKKVVNVISKKNNEKNLLYALENSYKSEIIFNKNTKAEIVVEFDGKETLEKFSKYVDELGELLVYISYTETETFK